jgi:hypothetical protein
VRKLRLQVCRAHGCALHQDDHHHHHRCRHNLGASDVALFTKRRTYSRLRSRLPQPFVRVKVLGPRPDPRAPVGAGARAAHGTAACRRLHRARRRPLSRSDVGRRHRPRVDYGETFQQLRACAAKRRTSKSTLESTGPGPGQVCGWRRRHRRTPFELHAAGVLLCGARHPVHRQGTTSTTRAKWAAWSARPLRTGRDLRHRHVVETPAQCHQQQRAVGRLDACGHTGGAHRGL